MLNPYDLSSNNFKRRRGTRLFLFFLFFMFLSGNCVLIGQASSDEVLETHVQEIISNLFGGNYDRAIELSDSVLRNVPLDCVQKGRVYAKIGYAHYYAYRELEALTYWQDSTLSIWETCDSLPIRNKAELYYEIMEEYNYLERPLAAESYSDKIS